ncbi:MAG: vWA domain-containing protein [Clostridium sp.]|nr:vWA domain-containing protein [Clostridium sp.]MDU7084060.1 vWA domain-containing protein [Clostridium sp.]
MINRIKNKKIPRRLCLIIAISLVFASIAEMGVIADEDAVSVKSDINNEIKPQINVNYLGSTPESPMVGQDFTVRYEIDPLPFYNNTSGEKEIVLVLDQSGSMKDNNKMKNLKTAATKFIDSLTVTTDDGKTPKITNLKIGIVAFSNYGNVKSDLIEVTSEIEVNTENGKELKEIINNLVADGGTNAGDGLRKGAYLLDKSNQSANKSLIFMADGEPTYYSYGKFNQQVWSCSCSRSKCGKSLCTSDNPCVENHGILWWEDYCEFNNRLDEGYYTTLDDTNPSRGGSGSSDRDGKSLGYATTIGNIIKEKKYKVFSIGYGLDNSGNNKMKTIHEAMGGISSGEKSTFFATDSGAIEAVFKQIADTLISSYSINDVKLTLNLGDSITAIGGFETPDGKGGTIKIEPIVYTKNDNNQYTAKKQIIEITVRANKEGEVPLLDSSSKITYIDINGYNQEMTAGNGTITIRPFSIDEAEKLGVDFKCIPEGYLVGDTVTGKVTFTHNGVKNVNYKDAIFTLDDNKPSNIIFTDGSSKILNFGKVASTINKDYKFIINDDEQVDIDKVTEYSIKGTYSYDLVKGSKTEKQTGEKETKLKVKRGLIKAKVIDEAGNDITVDSNLSIKDSTSSDKLDGIVNGEYIVFNNVKSGDYILSIEKLPQGCEPKEDGNSTILRVDYNNNLAEVIFTVKGVSSKANSKILKHGVYLNNNTNDIDKMVMESNGEAGINVTAGTTINSGIIVDVKGENTKIKLSSSQGNIDFEKIKIYEIGESGLIASTPKTIVGNIIELNEVKNDKCLILYNYETVKDVSKITLNAKIVDSTSDKDLILKPDGIKMPNLF